MDNVYDRAGTLKITVFVLLNHLTGKGKTVTLTTEHNISFALAHERVELFKEQNPHIHGKRLMADWTYRETIR
jgi:hypothetical protein